MLENLLSSPILASLALTLLHFLWQGILVAAVLKSLLLIFNHNKPQLRYALSTLAMLINLLLPLITFFIIYRTKDSPENYLTDSLVFNELIQELKQPDALFSYQELIETLPMLLPYISIVWLIATTLLASKLLIEVTSVSKLTQQQVITPSATLQTRFTELAKQINIKIAPRLLISLKVEVPMAIGWLKPIVLLPANMVSGLNNAQLEMLILHELGHIRRHDYLVNFFQTLVEILLFFHPSVSWVSKQMRNEREYCSDDIAVQHCGNAVAYAHTLVETASLCTKAHNHTIPDLAMAASGGDLKQRVVRLVDHHCAPKNNLSNWLASATIIFSMLLLSSKQLLTMPLLDIWSNQTPWQQSDNNQYNIEMSPTIRQTNNNIVQKYLPNPEKTQHLLTSTQPTYQKNNTEPQNLLLITSSKTIPSSQAIKKSSLILPTTQPIVNKVTSLTTQQHKTTKPNQKSDLIASEKSPMVEQAFKRTEYTNLYQQELKLLATEPADNRVSHEQQTTNTQQPVQLQNKTSTLYEIEQKASNSNSAKTTTLDNDTVRTIRFDDKKAVEKNSLTNINSPKETQKTPTVAIWQNAKQLKSVAPIYPNIAKRKGIELEVTVNFTIDAQGQIKDIQFAYQSKLKYFKNAIRAAIKQWRFLPATVGDKPVESQMSKVFAFSLQH